MLLLISSFHSVIVDLLKHPFIASVKESDTIEEYLQAPKKKWGNFLGFGGKSTAGQTAPSSTTTSSSATNTKGGTYLPSDTFVVNKDYDSGTATGDGYEFGDTV